MQLISPGDSQKSWAFDEWSRVTARTREEQNETMTRLTLFNCCDKREVWMWLLSSIHLYSSNVWNMVTLPCHIISLIHEQIIWSHITYIHSIMDHDFADVPHKLIHEHLASHAQLPLTMLDQNSHHPLTMLDQNSPP